MTGVQHLVAAPPRIAALRRNSVGYPIPFFVADQASANPDFRIAGRPQMRAAVVAERCWVCGQRRSGADDTFSVGPMCAVNRVSAEPPSHYECAEYSIKVCPFLQRPGMRRREQGIKQGADTMAGIPLLRNPGVGLLWTTTQWGPSRVNGGWLFDFGEPSAVSWWRQGRPATREECLAAIGSGMPELSKLCENPQDHADLKLAYQAALKLLPPPERPAIRGSL